MRDGWRYTRLGGLLEIQNGYAFKSKQFSPDGEIPLIRIRDIKNGQVTETSYTGDYDEKYVVRAGDYLIGMDGGFGCYEWRGPDALLNQRVCRLERFSDELQPRYLFYGINKYLKDIEDNTSYTTVKHISAQQIKEIEIPIPPMAEQERVVEILDTAFESIDKATANTETQLQNAAEIFDSALNARVTELADCYSAQPLAELCEPKTVTYGVIKLGKHIDGGVPCLRTSNVRRLFIDRTGMKQIHPSLSQDYSRTILQGGEVLVNVRGTLGGVSVVEKDMAGWNVSREVAVVPVDSKLVDPDYVAYWVAAKSSQDWLTGVLKGLAYTGINLTDLRLLPIVVPPLSVQRQFVTNLKNLWRAQRRLATNYSLKSRKLTELRQTILAKAFSGELTADDPVQTKKEAVA